MRLVCLAALLSVVAAVDQISNLPGVDWKLNFKHYSGFFQVSETHHLHYWFVESQNSPQTDPLIFWFNGGPGCSSLDGLLNEMGPYMAHKDGKTLVQNPNSWNKMASVVYIESPAGVGYSYSTDQNITTNDDQTSLENYEAVKKFFQTFPDFRDRSTYITGESYGGVYVPTLTARIIDGQKEFPINLKGMALGNGYVNAAMNVDTAVRFAHSHGLVDEKIWNTLEKECCKGCADSCDLSKVEGHCAGMVEDIFQFLWTGGLNPYDLYRDCDATPEQNGDRMTHILRGVAPRFEDIDYPEKNSSLLFRKDEKLYGAPCLNDSDVTSYMNDGDVRRALNIPINLGKWDICNDAVSDSYQKQYADMAPFIKKIINARVRVLLFYGDTDMACNFLMGQEFSANLGLKRRAGKTPWVVNHQIAGFKTLYEGLTFLTVRGAGHMAPQWKAPEMYHVIQQFLLNQPI